MIFVLTHGRFVIFKKTYQKSKHVIWKIFNHI